MTSLLAGRAALYVRMSTDHQRYSIAHQTARLQDYADENQLQVVKVYEDAGRSGLTFERREALKQLIQDVRGGVADFDVVLVYDVSRWGRFQDIDEAAFYEFTCRSAGIDIIYCEEAFGQGGSLNGILKSLKRVMAGEYSRELSQKVYTAKHRLAKQGLLQGGEPPYGLARYVVDDHGTPVARLASGERKPRLTDRVGLGPGAPEQIEIVRRIFDLYDQGFQGNEIARQLTSEGLASPRGRAWSGSYILRLLRNEAYVGHLVWGRTSFKLKMKFKYVGEADWVRAEQTFEGIVERDMFDRVQNRLRNPHRRKDSTPALLRRLRAISREGRLTSQMIEQAPDAPALTTVYSRFGSMPALRALIAAPPDAAAVRNLERRSYLRKMRSELIHAIRVELNAETLRSTSRSDLNRLRLKDGRTVAIFAALARMGPEGHFWEFHRAGTPPTDYMVCVCADPDGVTILQSYLLPWTIVSSRSRLSVGPRNGRRLTPFLASLRVIVDSLSTSQRRNVR